jgi:hypothetical protein
LKSSPPSQPFSTTCHGPVGLPPSPFAAPRRLRARPGTFARRASFRRRQWRPLSAHRRSRCRGAHRRHPRGPARVGRAGPGPRPRVVRARRRCRDPRAGADRDLGAHVHAHGVPRAAQCGSGGDRQQLESFRRPAAPRGAPHQRRAGAGLHDAHGHRPYTRGCVAALTRRAHVSRPRTWRSIKPARPTRS